MKKKVTFPLLNTSFLQKSTTIPTSGLKFGLINSSIMCMRVIELKWKLSTLLIRRINTPTKNKIHMYFLAEEKWCAGNTDYWLEPTDVKVEYLLGLTVFKCPKFHLVPLDASAAEFQNCTLPCVLIGGKGRPDVKDNYNCLMLLTPVYVAPHISHPPCIRRCCFIAKVIIIGFNVSEITTYKECCKKGEASDDLVAFMTKWLLKELKKERKKEKPN